QSVVVDHVVPLNEMAATLARLAAEPVDVNGDDPMPDDLEFESAMDEFSLEAIEKANRPGAPSGFACPDCGGAQWELSSDELIRFRCRVGHAWTVHSLLGEQSSA